MKRYIIFCIISIILIFCIREVFAGDAPAPSAESNFTSEKFMINVGNLSPLSSGVQADSDTSRGNILIILTFISNLFLYLIPVLAAVSGIIAGYFYIFSSGDSENTSRAKTIIKYNILAIILAFASYSIIVLITQFIG